MKQYLDLLQHILENGEDKEDRTGTGTRAIFGHQMRFNLEKDFPLVTTKKVHFKSVVRELLWFLKGDTNTKYLNDHGVSIWDAWADENGDLGPVYGKQWRSWGTKDGREIDQLSKIVQQIKDNPTSRRHIVSAWNVGELDQMALEPCHLLFQFYANNKKLSCQVYQRSCDTFLGVPFNIASYSLLTKMVAQATNLEAKELIWVGGDTHLYLNHFNQVKKQLSREPKKLPQLELNPDITNLFDFKYEDFKLIDYKHHPRIKAPIAA